MSPPLIRYPLDPTGILLSNLVVSEDHIVTDNNYKDFYFVVPKFAPFFIEGFVVSYSNNNSTRILVEGVDYYGCLPFIGASRSVAKQVYGGISFSDLTLVGVVTLRYQTLGGPYLFDDQVILENIANRVYNPRIVTWEEVTDKPDLFPPTNHEWNLVDQVGQTEVVNALVKIEQAILTRVIDPFVTHITRVDNPHDTNKTQIGLDKVENFPPATNDEAKALIATDRLITPATLKAILVDYQKTILAYVMDAFTLHITRIDNPHNLTKNQIGLGLVQNFPPANITEAKALTAGDRVITPATLGGVLSDIQHISTDLLTQHTSRIDNPHSTTKAQVGLNLVENFAPASAVEAKGLTATNKIITPATLGSVLVDYSKLKISADPGNSIVMRADGIYYSAPSSTPSPTATTTPAPTTPGPTTTNGPTTTPGPTTTNAPTNAPTSSPVYNEIVTITPSTAVGGTNVAINVTGGAPNTGFTITDQLTAAILSGTLDSSGNYIIHVTLITAEQQGQYAINVPISFSFGGSRNVRNINFISNPLPVTYNEAVTFTPAAAVAGTSVTISVTGGQPSSTFTITNALNGRVFTEALDSSGNFTTTTVIIAAAEQGPNAINVPFNFAFAGGDTRSFTYVSRPVTTP